VSKLTSSPARMTRSPHSWNHGLVRPPELSSRVSIHSPPSAMLVWCRIAHSSFSVMPGRSASRIRAMPASHTEMATFMQAISSSDLMTMGMRV